MHKLNLEVFLTGSTDAEARQYHILSGLQQCYENFSHNRLYPTLAELIALRTALLDMIHGMHDIQRRMSHDVKELDIEENTLIYEDQPNNDDLLRAAELITWAMPYMEKAIEEGVGIYSFVEEHMQIEHVGILPMYREEGYWFVPEHKAALLHLLRYELSLFSSSSERYRTLKTSNLGDVPQGFILESPESIKLRLIEQYHDLPNPATFICETDLDFPYTETILPIAKRKLMTQVFS